jgi:holo-[acyl-carrier protein] synthase
MRVGVDVVDVDRFRHSIRRTPGLVARLFTDDERAYANKMRDPASRLAVRFAAKEAAMKVLGVGIGAVGFHDLAVGRDETSSAPHLVVGGRAAELATEVGVVRWELSLTHSDLVAIAVVVGITG